jgi:energy-coupling factor transport system ATP-binding protein
MTKTLKPMQGIVHHHAISRSLLSVQFPEHYVTAITVAGEIKSWGLSPKPLLDMFSFRDRADDPVMSLSRGELKRLHLACVLAQHADLLVLDEPFASLDKDGQHWLFETLKSAKDQIVVISTHYGIPAQYPLMTHTVMNNGSFTQHAHQTDGEIV